MTSVHEHRPPLSVSEVAAYANLSERFIRRLIAERRIPFVKAGGTRIRFFPDDVDAWLEAQRVEAIEPPVAAHRVTRPLKVKTSTNGPKAKSDARERSAKS